MDTKIQPYVQSTNRNEQSSQVGTDPSKLDGASNKDEPLTSWDKQPTLHDLRADLDFARQETVDQGNNVKGWLDLRNATGSEAPRKVKPGRSAVQPKLVRKHNEWRYPALSEPFLNTDRMFQVLPRTKEDGPKAKQNQVVLNWQIDTKINKVDFIDRYVRTAVDEGTVIVRTGWERNYMTKEVETPIYDYFEVYPDQDEQEFEIISRAVQLLQNDDAEWESLPDDLKASAEKSLERQQVVRAVESGTTKVLEEVMCTNAPSLRVINTNNLFVDPSCDGDWENAQFMVYTYEATPSDLKSKKDQFKNLQNVNWETAKIQSQQGNPDHESNTPNTDSRTASDKQKVLVYEYWGLYDIHNKGVMVPIVVTWVGDTIIQMTENPFPDSLPPFVLVPYMPILQSVFGEADASLLQDNQRIVGAVTRGMIDLMGRSANAQTGYKKGFLDPINRRRFSQGEDFEFNPNDEPTRGMQQMVYPEIPQSAMQTIALQNQEAESLTGVKSFTGGISGDAYGQVATGIRGALDSAGTREMSILRRLAMGMQKIGQKMIAMNAKFLSEKEVIRVTNEEFVEISREDLAGNFDLKVDISTASVDQEKAQDLGMLLQTVGPDMDPGLRQIILSDIADLKRMPDLADRIRSYQPQPDPLQMELQKMEIEAKRASIALDVARAEQARASAEKIFTEVDDNNSGLKHEREVEKMGAQARGNRDLEVTKGLLKGETAPGMVEAAVGYNAITDAKEARDTAPRLGSGFSDPNAVPPQLAGQELPIGPLSSV